MVSPDRNLRSSLGLFDAVSVGLGAIIGGGIFIVTGIVAGLAGPALVVSIVLAAIISFFTAWSFSNLASWLPAEGGVYEYASKLLSHSAGFLGGWMWIVSNVFAGSAVSLGFSHYFVELFPTDNVRAVAVVLCFLFTVINYMGVKRSATFNNILVSSKMLILVVFIVVGIFYIRPSNFIPFLTSEINVAYGAYFIFFAFSGFARVAVVGEEVSDARRVIPRAIMLSLAISTIIYVLVGLVAVGLIGSESLGMSSSPLALAISVVGLPALVYIVALGGMLATASVLLTTILGVSRMLFAMSREGDMPSILIRLHPKYGTPYLSIFIVGAMIAIISAFIDLTGVVAVSTFASLFYYALANISAMRLKTRTAGLTHRFPLIGLLSCIALLIFVPKETVVMGLACFLMGAFYFIAVRRLRPLSSNGH